MNKIKEFNELHTSEELLFLGNAWDLLSALTLEKAESKQLVRRAGELPTLLDFQTEN